jgi:hypothetical protein
MPRGQSSGSQFRAELRVLPPDLGQLADLPGSV